MACDEGGVVVRGLGGRPDGRLLNVAPFRDHLIASLAVLRERSPARLLIVLAVKPGGKMARKLGGRRANVTPCWNHTPAALALLGVVRSAELCVELTEHFVSQFGGKVISLTCDQGSAVDGKFGRERRFFKCLATPFWRVCFLAVPAEVISAVIHVVMAKRLALRVAILTRDERGAVDGKVGRGRRFFECSATPLWRVCLLAVPAEVFSAVYHVVVAEQLALGITILTCDKRG